jgi:hypothetical protein
MDQTNRIAESQKLAQLVMGALNLGEDLSRKVFHSVASALGQAGSEIGSIGRYRHKEGAPHNAVVNLGEQICEG